MYGHPSLVGPAGLGPAQQSPTPTVVPPLDANLALQNPTIFLQTAPLFNPLFLQNLNLLLRNPNNVPIQNQGFSVGNGVHPLHQHQLPHQNLAHNPRESLEEISRAVIKAHSDLLAAGDGVTAWKVAQEAIAILGLDSWSCLGIGMLEVPTLRRLISIEGKVTAFIHCYLAVRSITSLYELEVEVCKNEGIKQFDELGLGPFLRQPFIVHYFQINSNVNEVIKLTSEDIIYDLCEFIDICKNKICVKDFLAFVAKKRSVKYKESLGIRIQNLGIHVSAIQKSRKIEDAMVSCMQASKSKRDIKLGEHLCISSEDKEPDEHFGSISHHVESFASSKKKFCGTHTRFVSTSSEDESNDASEDENIIVFESNPSLQNSVASGQRSGCPYPSSVEEMKRLCVRRKMHGSPIAASIKIISTVNRPPKKKRKNRNPVCSMSASSKLTEKDKVVAGIEESVNETRVACNMNDGTFSLRRYLRVLLQLSNVKSPSQAANTVFQVFLQLADALKSGLLSAEDAIYLKASLSKLKFTVLPTAQDKWVSLHPSFGLVYWCDDEDLGNEFRHTDNIFYLYFGELNEYHKHMLHTKIAILMKELGIPALSKVVTREAIYHGLADCSLKLSLINWALPYAQRYIYRLHHDTYFQLKQCGFDVVKRLVVVVVKKLYYRNVIKQSGSASNTRIECTCLHEENTLYTTQESDSHAMFVELSRLLFDGLPALDLADFLNTIKSMVEFGSTEEQIEMFMLNSQKLPKLPDEESVWHLSSLSSKKEGISLSKPSLEWKTASDSNYSHEHSFESQAAQMGGISLVIVHDDSEDIPPLKEFIIPIPADAVRTIKDGLASTSVPLTLSDAYDCKGTSHPLGVTSSGQHTGDSITMDLLPSVTWLGTSAFSRKNDVEVDERDAAQTGRLGELLAYKYFVGKVGETAVKWVNEVHESGLPYDIVINGENGEEYMEVKSTMSPTKARFEITSNEWLFAVDTGEKFSIVRIIVGNNLAKLSIFKNPVKLCQLGQLQKQFNDSGAKLDTFR